MVKNVKASGTKLDASMMVEIVARTPMVKNAKMILLSSKKHKVHKSFCNKEDFVPKPVLFLLHIYLQEVV